MQLYCPSCKTSIPATERCPNCGDRLVTPSEIFASSGELHAPPPALIRPTQFGRIVVGTIVSIGLYIGLREEVLGLVAASEVENPFVDATAIAMTLTLRTISILVGGLFAGAGRTHGFLTGWITGLVCGALLLGVDVMGGHKPTALDWGATVGLAVVAAMASVVGSRVWPPVVDIPVPVTNPRGSSLARLATQDDDEQKVRPTAWFRLGLAVAIGVVGIALAESLRVGVKKTSGGALNIGTPLQGPYIDFAFAVFGLALAGTVAGGNTGAGFRHGVFFGIGTGLLTTALLASGNTSVLPPIEGLLGTFGIAADSARTSSGLLTVFATLFTICVLASLFGSILLPTVAPKWRRSRLMEQA